MSSSDTAVAGAEDTSGMTEMQKKLFNIRMKINQGRKANKAEVEDEYRRFNDPKYEQKKYVSRKNAQAADQVDALGEEQEQPPKWNTDKNAYMQQTAESAEFAQEKITKKEKNMSTFGWQAFTAEATYKAYKKKLNKLPTAKGVRVEEPAQETALESNPLNYGQINTKVNEELNFLPLLWLSCPVMCCVWTISCASFLAFLLSLLIYSFSVSNQVSKAGLDRMSQDVTDRQEANRRFSKRRMTLDAADVDSINERNANFNKKLKRSFDKYTVEIRQNLERGTALWGSGVEYCWLAGWS